MPDVKVGQYEDGCTYRGRRIVSCLACPLPKCRHEGFNGEWTEEMERARLAGVGQEIAKPKCRDAVLMAELGVCRSTITRWRRKGKL